ncbi:nuclear transport factor 2 family protein [Olivibacter sp. XZL3]|uniref:nuclear transport factor 2 family protein n=1 Tax=Olivibacter sp. XZL3 TaxID=1735116 RepID=UPI0010649AD3|nr:nuclear transport factor 2 family protein [Olivibacter sp. XZL3]
MNLQPVLLSLVEAQNNHDSKAYAECFTDTAIAHDEGKTYKGKEEIRQWIEKANREYNAVMKPLDYSESEAENLLTAEVSGDFPGSPAILKYHIRMENVLISSLRITG